MASQAECWTFRLKARCLTRVAESTRKMIRTVRVIVVELESCYLDAREVVVKSCMVEGPFGEPGGGRAGTKSKQSSKHGPV
jgi:hypothetical protein